MVLKSRLFMGAAAAAIMSSASPAFAQGNDSEVQALRAEVQALKDQLAAISAKVDAADAASKAAAKKPAVPETKWKGAPETVGEGGWTFKPRGRIHLDTGFVSTPGAYAENRNLGHATRLRRVRLGVEGTIPGNLGYKVDVDFNNNNVSFGDVWFTYSPKNAPITLRIGNFETLNSLEQISGSNNVSFIERNAFNEGFINARRLGAALAWHDKDDSVRLEAGIFTGHSIDGSIDNDGSIAAARAIYAPKFAGGQLHLGLNYQYRDFASNNRGVANPTTASPSQNQLARYRARPLSQLTDVRFIDTGSFAAKGDQIIGAELAGVFKSLYFAGEVQWLRANSYAAGDRASGLDLFAGGNTAVVPTGDPSFFGGYGEVGFFITGETRAYSKGIWGRTKVLKPIGSGGGGAFQVAARFDYLDLDDAALKNGLTNDFTTGTTSLAAANSRLGRGGKQSAYQLGLNWYPIDYIRFMLNYSHVNVEGGPLAAVVDPLSIRPVDQRKYGVDVVAARMQVEF